MNRRNIWFPQGPYNYYNTPNFQPLHDRPYYPFSMQVPTLPFNTNYPYNNHSFNYLYNKNNITQSSYDSHKVNYFEIPHETKEASQKTFKRIMNLQSSDKIKQSQREKELTISQTKILKKQLIQKTTQKNSKIVEKQKQKIQLSKETIEKQQVTLKRQQIQEIFKKLLKSFVDEQSAINLYSMEYKYILGKLAKNTSQRQLFQELFLILKHKFDNFRKTKEELIKYIIRRTYHIAKNHKNTSYQLQYERLQAFHDRNMRLHKSMNLEFLKKQFSNKTFLMFYQEFYEQIEIQFIEENNEKIQKMSNSMTLAWLNRRVSLLEFEKKLPWLSSYMTRIKLLAKDLHKKHTQNNESETQILLE